MKTAVVIATWEGHSPKRLISLCKSIDRFQAKIPFDLALTINGFGYEIPEKIRSRFVAADHRRNEGFNLGAWDHAWRKLANYDRFLFIQDDCRAARDGWLRDFADAFDRTENCGLVGENLNRKWNRPWNEIKHATRASRYRAQLEKWGIPPGQTARHLTAVVHYTSRVVLEAIGGYRVENAYEDAIAAEIGFSRKLEAAGYSLIQVGSRPHTRIVHPEWRGGALKEQIAQKLRIFLK